MFTRGLKGIIAAETKLSKIDGINGELVYRGIPIYDLVINYSFEEVAYFLWYGALPNQNQLSDLKQQLKMYRKLPRYLYEIIEKIPEELDIMSVLRTTVSAIKLVEYDEKPNLKQAIQITAMIPTIIAYRYRFQRKLPLIEPYSEYDHVKNFLYMLDGDEPLDDHVIALESYMILTMEHGMNASTFSARVTISTESDMISAITSAIGTMKGPLHGGAPSGVISLLEEIGEINRADVVIKRKLEKQERLMGFGHRIYKTSDPRALAMKAKLLEMNPKDNWLQLAIHVEEVAVKLLEEFKPGRKLNTNVEFYAAAIMRSIQLDTDLFTPTFSAARCVGWTAHSLEQINDNTIFRPEAIYIGK